MPEKQRKTFLMWSRTKEYKAKVVASLEDIRHSVASSRCVVAYSGGKDSTAMTHLVLQVEPDVTVFHWDHGSWLIPRDIEAEIVQNAGLLGVTDFIAMSSRSLEKPEARTNWRIWYAVFWSTLARLRKEHGWEKNFVGLRREEGCKRRAKIDKHNVMWEVYPIADWSWLDVWAYIVSNDLPYPRVYDLYAPLLGWDKARFVTFFDMEFEKFGAPYLDGFLQPQYRFVEK